MKLLNLVYLLFSLLFSLPALATDANLAAFHRGDFEQAVLDLESARASLNPNQETNRYLDISIRLAISYQNLGFLQTAKNILHSLEPIARSCHDPRRYAILLAHLSDAYLATGRSQEQTCLTQKASQEKASKYINHAVTIAQSTQNQRLLANLYNKQANLRMAQADRKQENFQKADWKQENFQKALSLYKDSLQLAEQVGDKTFRSKIWLNIVQAIVQIQDYEMIALQFEQSIFDIFVTTFKHIQTLPDSQDKTFSLMGLAQFISQLLKQVVPRGEPQQHNKKSNDFLSSHNSVLRQARGERLPPPNALWNNYRSSLQLSHLQTTQLRQYAYQALTQALQIAQNNQNHRGMSYAKAYLGQLYEEARRYEEAIQLTRQAIFYAQHHHYYPQLLYRWQWQLGRLFQAQGFTQAAIDAYRQAVQSLGSEKVRESLTGGYRKLSQSFRESTGVLYFQLADLLLVQASQQTDKKSLLHEAKKIIERFKEAELQDYFQDECLLERQRIYAKSNVEQTLPRQTAVLYPILFDNRIELLLSLPDDKVQQFTVSNLPYDLRHELEQFREQLKDKDSKSEIQDNAEQLYDLLMEPVIHTLEQQQVTTLIIVPDGILLTIPFAALYDGSQYLIERYAIVITPTLEMYDLTHNPRQNIRMLLGGYSKEAQYESKGLYFAPLKNVPRELKEIPKKFPRNQLEFTLLQEEEFTLSNLTSELANSRKTNGPYTIIHFATHGHFKENPNETFLVTADKEPMKMNQLKQLVGMTELSKPVELLVLSACQTAKGNDRAALGLAGVALQAGVRSAVASLWLVDDAASAQLMSYFYHHLQNVSKAQALQKAQQDMLKGNYSHPSDWAAFLLIGNGL